VASLDDRTRQRILDAVFRHLPRDRWDVLLFGSFARGTADVGSDIDLAVRGPERLRPAVAERIVADLEDTVPMLRDYDLVDLRQAGPALRQRVEQEGIPWHRATTTK